MRTLPSAPQLTNTSTLWAQKRTSKTSLSCAISWVLAVSEGMSQIVQVVSMLLVMIKLGDTTFQSSEVIGAVCSGDLELDRSASGDSFWTGPSRDWEERDMELDRLLPPSVGRDQSRKWSPDVARRLVSGLLLERGSQRMRVTG